MDQKNTIVKCALHNCLFNHNGVCDNYVINIGADGKCEYYVETESIRGQKTCHPDCIHFDDSDIMVGPVCLFNHPEPLKDFVEGMPCDYYHKRGHRAKCNMYDDATFNLCSAACHNYDFKGASLYCQLRQEYLGPERLLKPCDLFVKAENDKITVKMKIAELNKPNKNKSTIKEVMPECDLPVCDWSCRHALRDGPSFNPYIWCDLYKMNPAMGLFCSLKEEEK